MAETFEVVFIQYGAEHDGILINRSTAQTMATFADGKYVDKHGALYRTASNPGIIGRILSTRLEDNPVDKVKGEVIATCEPVWNSTGPYTPEMETK